MGIFFILLVIFLVCCCFILCLAKYKIKSICFLGIWWLISIIMFFYAFCFEPEVSLNLDLNRVFNLINEVKCFGYEILDSSDLKNLYFIKNFYACVAMTPFISLVTSIPLLVDFLIFGYIMFDLIREKYGEKVKLSYVSYAVFIWIALMGLKLAITDIRCNLAVALFSLAIYWEYVQEKKYLIAYMLYTMAIFTHYFAFPLLAFRLLITIYSKIGLYIRIFTFVLVIMCLFLFSNDLTVSILRDVPYIGVILSKYVEYSIRFSVHSYMLVSTLSMKLTYMCFVLISFLSCLFSVFMLYKEREVEYKYSLNIKMNRLILIFSFLGIAFCNNYLITERLMYLYAYLISMEYILYSNDSCIKYVKLLLTPILIYVFYFNDVNTLLANYMGGFFLSL